MAIVLNKQLFWWSASITLDNNNAVLRIDNVDQEA